MITFSKILPNNWSDMHYDKILIKLLSCFHIFGMWSSFILITLFIVEVYLHVSAKSMYAFNFISCFYAKLLISISFPLKLSEQTQHLMLVTSQNSQ